MDPDEPTIRCRYCTAVVENPHYHPPQPAEPAVPSFDQPEPPSYTYTPRPYTPSASPANSGLKNSALVLGVLVLVLLLGSGAYLVYSITSRPGASPLKPVFPLQILSPVIMLNTDGGNPNFIANVHSTAKSNYALARLDLSRHTVLWTALEQPDYLRIDALLAGSNLLYLASEDRLLALQLSDGQPAWEAALPDKLSGACERCLLFHQGQVLVLTMDNSLSAYDAQTGRQSWVQRFDNTGYSLYPLDAGVALLYRNAQGSAFGVFDAASGAESLHLAPTCEPPDSLADELDFYSNILIDSSGQPAKLYAFYGLFNACVQRWDLASGQMDWEYVETDHSLDHSGANSVLLANGKLFYAQGDQLRSLEAASGQQPQLIDQSEDYALLPLLVDGQRLVVRAKRTRGSTRFELWGYDLAAGQRLWQTPLLKSAPLDPPDEKHGIISADESGWTYRQTSGGSWLITFQTVPNQVVIAQVDLDTGVLANPKRLSLGIADDDTSYLIPERIASWDRLAWYIVNNRIYAIDPSAEAFPYRWP
jgi:outer membrane protein assembly factor BamB